MAEEFSFDIVIAGGGSAGCVLASRLSEDPGRRVLLIEMGRDTPPDQVDAEILASYPRVAYFNPRNTWDDLRVYLRPIPHNAPDEKPPIRRYEQARIMGGGSSINDMQAIRGLPSDYNNWQAMGAAGWGWDDVLPYFKKLERDQDYDGPLHGKDGRIPVRRIMRNAWPGFSHTAEAAMAEAGFRDIEDQNGCFEDGYFPMAITNLYDRRVSAAIGYLDNAVRRRPNLAIWDKTRVLSLDLEGKRVVGLRAQRESGEVTVKAGQVILSSGALHSPGHLMRAGIGPGAHLRDLGIDVVADRPGVGQNLQEHPTTSVSAYLDAQGRIADPNGRHIHLGLRYSSGLEGCPPGDMYMVALTKTGWHPVGKRICSLVTWVNKSYSRGWVKLQSANPLREPEVAFNMLADQRDAERLKGGFRMAAKLFDQPALKAQTHDPFPTSYSERIRDLGQVNLKNKILTGIMAKLMDGPPALRRLLIDRVITEGAPLRTLLADDGALESFVRETVHGVWHASGTCRMGAADNPESVVDTEGRVIGIEGLRVVDGSVIPEVPCANTNLPIIMIAEKMADAIKQA